MRSLPRLALAGASLTLAACSAASPPGSFATTTPPTPLATPATAAELAGLAKSDNAFSLDFYGKVRAKKAGNLVLSPFSLSTALAMTWAGAKGETAAQMARVLHLDGSPERTLAVSGALLASYGATDQKVTVKVANRLFGEKTYAFEQPFLAEIKGAFGAPLEPLDFKHAFEDGRNRINGWVSGETHDRIKNLVPAGSVDDKTRLALVNAVYFLGAWATPFDKKSTSPAAFFTGKSAREDVPTMHQQESFRFAATDGVEVLELPYEGGALAMDLVLPDARDGLDAVEARLTPAALDRWIGAFGSAMVDVALPRFEIAPEEPLSAGDTLRALGMTLAFDDRRADFTGIANPPDPDDRVHVSAAFHKAFIKMDEARTEAAAASAVLMAVPCSAPEPEPARAFKADHPFLFLLRDVRSGLVLFMGRVADPAKT